MATGEILTCAYDSGGNVTSAVGVKDNTTYHYLDRLMNRSRPDCRFGRSGSQYSLYSGQCLY